MTAVPSLLVVRPDRHEGLTRLRKAGVWLAMDPQAIAAFQSLGDTRALSPWAMGIPYGLGQFLVAAILLTKPQEADDAV